MADALKKALKMSTPLASASSDISQYINHRLSHDQRLRKMSETLKSHVRETLGEKAAGMYVSQFVIAAMESLSFHYQRG
jgi:hypothetical protein